MGYFLWAEPTYIEWLNRNYWWPVILCVLIVALGFYFIFLYKPKIKDKPLSEEEINAVINLFGGKENIKAITKEGSRYSFKLDKVEKCNLEKIKEFGATGVFVSGDVVKLIFPFNADVIMEKFSL